MKKRCDFYINLFLDHIEKNRKKNTFFSYKSIFFSDYSSEFKQEFLFNITEKNINLVLEKAKNKGLSSTTLQNIYVVYCAFFNYCIKQGYYNKANPCFRVERPKREPKQYDTISELEIKQVLFYLLSKSNEYRYYIFYLAFKLVMETGLRRGELAGLILEDIDFLNGTITINRQRININGHIYVETPKTVTAYRTLYISNEIMLLLKAHKDVMQLNKQDFVFVWQNGLPVNPEWFTSFLKKILKECGIDKKIRFHDLRHSNATLLLVNGVDMKTVQYRLGHSDISITMNTYAHCTITSQKKAIEIFNNIVSNK